MSRYSQEEIEESRLAIEKSASELFRLKGYHGVGLAEITKSAGLTNGTFYAHFKSKRDLFENIIVKTILGRGKFLENLKSPNGFEQAKKFVEMYLSAQHFQNEKGGCLMPRLAGDLKEHGLEKYSSPKKYIDEFAEFLASTGLSKNDGQFITASLIGTLVTARTLPEKDGYLFLESNKKIIIEYIKQKLEE